MMALSGVRSSWQELRLVLARLGELPALVLDFVEQSHVLDRDHRLVGEARLGFAQFDGVFNERIEDRLQFAFTTTST
jgi:hypothetical protein